MIEYRYYLNVLYNCDIYFFLIHVNLVIYSEYVMKKINIIYRNN